MTDLNTSYLVSVSGRGIPCLAIGIGTLLQRTLSSKFKESFQVYASDWYWDCRSPPPTQLTMRQTVEDIHQLAQELKLPPFVMLAHSAFGLVALEYAKAYPSSLRGVVMIGTPLNSNPKVAQVNNDYFERHAEPERKCIDRERRRTTDTTGLTPAERFLREYIWRDAARYWYDPAYDCSWLWEGIELNGELINRLFWEILPAHDAQVGLAEIECPILLAAGMADYDCCPWMWAEIPAPPPNLTIVRFQKSGHWPHFEEPILFDQWSKRSLGLSAR